MSKRRLDFMVSQVGTILSEMHSLHFRSPENRLNGWQPRMNVYRYPDHYELCIELAGVDLEDVQLSVQHRSVRIEGNRKWPDLKCKKTQHRCERTTLMEIEEGQFWREIELPEAVDNRDIDIQTLNGLVWINLRLL